MPFYGQGMNCGFEDCAELDALIGKHDHDWEQIFPAYENARKPNGDAIAELSKRNFIEMSDLSGDAGFQLRKKIEAKFSKLFPKPWMCTLFNGDILPRCALFGGAANRR